MPGVLYMLLLWSYKSKSSLLLPLPWASLPRSYNRYPYDDIYTYAHFWWEFWSVFRRAVVDFYYYFYYLGCWKNKTSVQSVFRSDTSQTGMNCMGILPCWTLILGWNFSDWTFFFTGHVFWLVTFPANWNLYITADCFLFCLDIEV